VGLFLLGSSAATAQSNPDLLPGAEKKQLVDSFELIWRTLRDRYWDASMAGLD
jgi:hypothetical protein